MEISSTFWLHDITDWLQQQEDSHSKYPDLSNLACDIFSIIPHCFRVEGSVFLEEDVIRWRQSKTTGETFGEKVIVRQFAGADKGLLAGDNPASDTTSTEKHMEVNIVAEEKMFHQMAKVHIFLEIWQGRQYLQATQKESRTQNIQMTAIGYISDTEEIIKVS